MVYRKTDWYAVSGKRPVFAVEVRSEDDYGTFAEKRMAAKATRLFRCGNALCVGRGTCSARTLSSLSRRRTGESVYIVPVKSRSGRSSTGMVDARG